MFTIDPKELLVEQISQNEIQEAKGWIDADESTYKRDLKKIIELIKWVLENLTGLDTFTCEVTEIRKNEIIDKINKQTLFLNPIH